MAWEWLDTVEGLEGSIAEIGGLNTTWDYALNHIGNPMTWAYTIATSSNYSTPPASISGTNGAFYSDITQLNIGETKRYSTDWGFNIDYIHSSGTGTDTIGIAGWSHDGRNSQLGGLNMKIGMRFAVDHARQIAVMVLASYFYNGAYYLSVNACWSEWYNPTTQQRENTAPYLYQILMEHQPPQYIWSSVPAISGKNGILQLTTLDESIINNGEAVSGASADGINFTNESKIDVLCGDGGLWWFPTRTVDVGYDPEPLEVDILTATYFEYSVRAEFEYAAFSDEYVTGTSSVSVAYSNIQAWLGILIDNENEVAKFSIVYIDSNVQNTFSYNQNNNMSDDEMHALWLLLHENIVDPDDDEDLNENENDGDEGTNKRTDRPAAEPDMPACDSIGTGFVSLWKCDKTALQNLSTHLWSDAFWDVVHKFFADPREVIIGCQIMPVTPTSGTEVESTATQIISGRIETGIYAFKFLKQFKKVECGSINLSGVGNNFFAYSPYTSIAIYLPFCGYHDLDVNDLMKTNSKTGCKLTLKYVFDFLSGTCTAMLAVNGSYKYFFSGNCAQQVPISSADYRDILKTAMGLGATIGAGMITQGAGGMTAPAATQAADMMNSAVNAMNAQPHIAFSSGGGSTAGYLQSRRPCLIISEPIAKKANNQWHYTGKQALQSGTIDGKTGYTKILEAHFSDIPCTAEEKDDIFKQFKAGVMINANSSELPDIEPATGEQTIVLIKNKSENRVMRKNWNKAQCNVTYGKLFYEKGILKPTFVVSGDYSAFNYAYLPAFNRFYYITNQTVNTGSVRTLELSVDALESWKDQIKNCKAVFERQENMSNWYMQDNLYFAEARKNVTTIPFNIVASDSNTEFSFKNTSECYVLTVAGG